MQKQNCQNQAYSLYINLYYISKRQKMQVVFHSPAKIFGEFVSNFKKRRKKALFLSIITAMFLTCSQETGSNLSPLSDNVLFNFADLNAEFRNRACKKHM